MTYNIINAVFFGGLLFLLFDVIGTIREMTSKSLKESHNNARLKKIKEVQNINKKTDKETINEITKPFITKYFPRLRGVLPSLSIENLKKVEDDLVLAGWDDIFTASSFVALSLILKIIGVISLITVPIFSGALKLIGLVWFAGCFFLLDAWLAGDVSKKEDDLFNGFPEFIRITSSFLSADIPFVDAVDNAIHYVNDAWKPILTRFVAEANSLGIDTALVNLRNAVDIFEVKEFVGLVRLTLEQGGNAKEGFDEQADKIQEMKKARLIKIIATRKIYVTILDFPLLLSSITIIALPMVANIGVFLNL